MVSDVALHVVNAKNDWVVKFNPDGTIEINPEYTKEEAARQFVAIVCELYSEEHRSLREKLAKAEAALAQEKAEAVRVKVKPPEDAVEDLARWLHSEVEWPEYDFQNHSWPDHPDDDGKRGNGYLKIIPRSSADQFREIARRILSALEAPAAEAPIGYVDRNGIRKLSLGSPAAIYAAIDQWSNIPLYAAPPAAEQAGDGWTRNDLAKGLAILDGVTLREIKATVGDPEDASNWREYLGRADDLLAHLSAAAPKPKQEAGE